MRVKKCLEISKKKFLNCRKIELFYGFGDFLRFSFISDLVRDKKCLEIDKKKCQKIIIFYRFREKPYMGPLFEHPGPVFDHLDR